MMMPHKTFLSSTTLDLYEHRRVLLDQLHRMKLQPLAMEYLGSHSADPTAVCAREIEECDLFIGVYAFRYGYTSAEGSPSITEQEYDIAQARAKRCLCYCADVSTEGLYTSQPTWQEEPQWKRDQLASFKQRLDQEIVRDTFVSPEDLARKVAADIARIQRGDPLGVSMTSVTERWRRSEIETRQELFLAELSGRPDDLVPSPLTTLWNAFIKGTAWHTRQACKLDAIRREAEIFPEFESFAREVQGIDYLTTYSVLRANLKNLPFQDWAASLSKTRDRLLRKMPSWSSDSTGGSYAIDAQRVVNIQRLMRRIQHELDRPQYSRCFCIIGGLGSGKTHFIASLLSQSTYANVPPHGTSEREVIDHAPSTRGTVPSEGHPLILILEQPFHVERLQEIILNRVREITGTDWRNLKDFHDLIGEGQRVVIVIDDIHLWSQVIPTFAEQLVKCIDQYSSLHSLYWLITAQDTQYDRIAPTSQFWDEYAGPSDEDLHDKDADMDEPVPLSGWIVLDTLNQEKQVGLNILRKSLARESGAPKLALDYLPDATVSQQYMCIPLFAWVLFDLRETIGISTVINLRFIQFVNHLWGILRSRGCTGRNAMSMEDLDEAIGLVSRVLVVSRQLMPPYTAFLNAFVTEARNTSELQDRQRAAKALDGLRSLNLLKVTHRCESPYADPVKHLQMHIPMFWWYHMARQLFTRHARAGSRSAIEDEFVKWCADIPQDHSEGIYEFLLLLADDAASHNDIDWGAAASLWEAGLRRAEIPSASVWFAGGNASDRSKEYLFLSETPGVDMDPHQTFAFMYFLSRISSDVVDTPHRFQRLRPYLRAIRDAKLASYYLYFAASNIEKISSNRTLFACMCQLSGSESLGVAHELAGIVVQALWRNCDNDVNKVVATLMSYLRSQRDDKDDKRGHRANGFDWTRESFREWVLFVFCHRFVRTYRSDAYAAFEACGWFRLKGREIARSVPIEMMREASIALGFFYRELASLDEQRLFVASVRALIDTGGHADRECAFYMIRHTAIVRERDVVLVERVFHPLLKEIMTDQRLKGLVGRFRDFFEANLGSSERMRRKHRRNGRKR